MKKERLGALIPVLIVVIVISLLSILEHGKFAVNQIFLIGTITDF